MQLGRVNPRFVRVAALLNGLFIACSQNTVNAASHLPTPTAIDAAISGAMNKVNAKGIQSP